MQQSSKKICLKQLNSMLRGVAQAAQLSLALLYLQQVGSNASAKVWSTADAV